jgi:phenylalanyl-tRNA synthetase alpha chain
MDIKEVDGLTAQALAGLAGAADGRAGGAAGEVHRPQRAAARADAGAEGRPAADKPAMGQALNRFKVGVTAAVAERKAALEATAKAAKAGAFDLSLPGRWPRRGRLHPIAQLIDRTRRSSAAWALWWRTGRTWRRSITISTR